MPQFNTLPPVGLYPGDTVSLINTGETGIQWTQAVTIATQGVPTWLSIENTTNQVANVMVALRDNPSNTSNYKQLTNDDGTPVTVPTGSTQSFTTQGPFIACYFPGAPSSGGLIIGR